MHYFLRGKRTASIVSNTRNSMCYPIKELKKYWNGIIKPLLLKGSFPQLAPTASDN